MIRTSDETWIGLYRLPVTAISNQACRLWRDYLCVAGLSCSSSERCKQVSTTRPTISSRRTGQNIVSSDDNFPMLEGKVEGGWEGWVWSGGSCDIFNHSEENLKELGNKDVHLRPGGVCGASLCKLVATSAKSRDA